MSGSKRSNTSFHSMAAQGEPLIWLTGGMFAIACSMVVALLGFVLYQGLATLWQRPYTIFALNDGAMAAGEIVSRVKKNSSDSKVLEANASVSTSDSAETSKTPAESHQLYIRTGNYDVTNRHFAYVSENDLSQVQGFNPKEVWLMERREWGVLFGFPKKLESPITPAPNEPLVAVTKRAMQEGVATHQSIERAKHKLEIIDRRLAKYRLAVREVELEERSDLQAIVDQTIESASMIAADPQAGSLVELISPALENISPKARKAIELLATEAEQGAKKQLSINKEIAELEVKLSASAIVMQVPSIDTNATIAFDGSWSEPIQGTLPKSIQTWIEESGVKVSSDYTQNRVGAHQWLVSVPIEGRPPFYLWAVVDSESKKTNLSALQEKRVLVSDIVRLVEPNNLSLIGKLSLYLDRWTEFLFGQPREAGVEGGFFPAIWGTIVMTMVMSIAVMPFGVMAALYMREYAKGGWVVSLIRISINNLAGVPSIVYGVFGLAFFCYTIGGFIDGGPVKAGFVPWPSGVWFFALAALSITGTSAFMIAYLGSGSPTKNSGWKKRIMSFSGILWLVCLVILAFMIFKSPFFHGFYRANLPNPTFGKGCLLWAACTLALLTLPVVIVATEEALSAVPNSLREGSYACGAGKWQTLQRIVLPYARPGIITGFILAMARGAGEVAPMMLVGAIPLATDLPLDLEFPFLHGSRSFMHLGFQIYSLGFQSQNSEAAKPMVFTATLLLLTIVTLLNVSAIWLRARLRKRFQSSQF